MADLEKTGILGSWILRNIFQNHQIEEHFEQSPAYLNFHIGKFSFIMQIILNYPLFDLLNIVQLIMICLSIKLLRNIEKACFRIRGTSNTFSGSAQWIYLEEKKNIGCGAEQDILDFLDFMHCIVLVSFLVGKILIRDVLFLSLFQDLYF
jgi:hypothetical protein